MGALEVGSLGEKSPLLCTIVLINGSMPRWCGGSSLRYMDFNASAQVSAVQVLH